MNFTSEEILDLIRLIEQYSHREDPERGNEAFCVDCDADSLSSHKNNCEVKRLLDLLGNKI